MHFNNHPVCINETLRLEVFLFEAESKSSVQRHHLRFTVPSLERGRCLSESAGGRVLLLSDSTHERSTVMGSEDCGKQSSGKVVPNKRNTPKPIRRHMQPGTAYARPRLI